MATRLLYQTLTQIPGEQRQLSIIRPPRSSVCAAGISSGWWSGPGCAARSRR
ncbi:Thiamin ABC transporter, transmembrane component [Cronobacter malonaticus 681]|nr:Thiamin ABC transporter, transmembrane component [Cronobacter malonaticus 681]